MHIALPLRWGGVTSSRKVFLLLPPLTSGHGGGGLELGGHVGDQLAPVQLVPAAVLPA